MRPKSRRGACRQLQSFSRDVRGNIAIFAALSAIPFMMVASAAVNFGGGVDARTQLQAAADAAVLAGAARLATGQSNADKEELTLAAFNANLSGALQSTFTAAPVVDIDFPQKIVRLDVTVHVESALGDLLGDDLEVNVTSAAKVAPGSPICLMTLNPSAENALRIQGTADVVANGCSVHVNSGHDEAMQQVGSAVATADSFCVHGGYLGSNYSPPPDAPCEVEKDPLADYFADDWAALNQVLDTSVCTYTDLDTIDSATDGTVTVLQPGVYCGGVNIKKGTVELVTNGNYVFRDGPLYIQAHGTLKATSVPILLTGDSDTRLITQAGASLITSARSTGLFAGIALAQHPSSIPASENLIIGGGQIEMNGIMYYPAQTLKISGNGDIGQDSTQFAIIADMINIEGNGALNITIGQNYQNSGLPDLPEAHEKIHLIE